MKIGVMFGNPETTTGGNALKFYASLRLDIRRGLPIKRGDEVLGSHTKVKVVKNKMAPPFRVADFEVWFNQGVNRMAELVDLAESAKVLSKTGSWYSFGETRIGQGRDKSCEFLRDNPDLAAEIENRLNQALLDNVIALEQKPAASAPRAGEAEKIAEELAEPAESVA